MQSKFKTDYGNQGLESESTEKTAASLSDTMKRLNIIDMTGSATQIQTSLQAPPQGTSATGVRKQ